MPGRAARLGVAACLAAACRGGDRPGPAPEARAPAAAKPATVRAGPVPAAAIAHAGVGTAPAHVDGCRAAVDGALAALARGAEPIDAAVEGVMVMEDDPRFNAGTGSVVRIDGETVQMDAAVMDSSGRFGAVAVIEGVRNPVRVARAVADTPHLVLAGDGATRFARTLGMPPYDPATDERRARAREMQAWLRRADPDLPEAWRRFDWRARWNFERAPEPAAPAGRGAAGDAPADTVGVAVRASDGRFAAALSTGGTSVTLRGRVGDVPILGAGLFAGPHGAAAATGVGERIVEAGLARAAHGWLGDGASAEDGARRAVETLGGRGAIGIVVIGAATAAAAADRPMAWAAREAGSDRWQGPGR